MNNFKSAISIFLLCGGKGERLKPLTDSIPKPLIPINGRPIIDYQIKYFQKFGLDDFVVAIGYKADVMREYFRKNDYNAKITLIDSGDVDIVERIKDARGFLKEDFILCYGDTLADVSLTDLYHFHSTTNAALTMTTYPMKSPFGIVEIDDKGKVFAFQEKPTLNYWINIGYMYFSSKALSDIEEYNSFVDFLDSQRAKNQLYSYKHQGVHITVNTFKELDEAEKDILLFDQNS